MDNKTNMKNRANEFSLSPRLQVLFEQATALTEQIRFWDIGCDHGLVGGAIFKKSHYQEIHLVDPVLKNKDHENIPDALELKKLFIHPMRAQEMSWSLSCHDTVLLAGMGARTIIGILQHILMPENLVDGKKRPALILSPHSELFKLKEFLKTWNWDFELKEMRERDRIYPLILA